MRLALVLGAGGAYGWVWHVGVLRALSEAGIDPSDADLVVGTSAGSAVGAALTAGVDVDTIVESVIRPPTEEERARIQEVMRNGRRTIRPLAPTLVRHALRGAEGVGTALAGLLPPGWFPTDWLHGFPGVDGHVGWPDGLWIPALRTEDGSVVVFGRDRRDVPVAEAVEASSAVPGMFRPKRLGDETYVDAGIVSPTHADITIERRPDLVLVSSPMTRPGRRGIAQLARRRLDAEIGRLREAGIETVEVVPDEQAGELARGFPRRRPEAAPAIEAAAERITRRALDESA